MSDLSPLESGAPKFLPDINITSKRFVFFVSNAFGIRSKIIFSLQNLLHCAWSPDGELVSAGSADRFVYIWDTNSRKIMYKLPGHLGSVNDVDFHRMEPIVLSASSDKQIYLGEFDDCA